MNKLIAVILIFIISSESLIFHSISKLEKHQEFTAQKELALEREIQAFFKMLPMDKQIELYEYLKTK